MTNKGALTIDAVKILQLLDDGFIRTSKDGKIIMANNAAVKYCGYSSSDEMIGLQLKSLYANPEDRTFVVNEIEEKGGLTNYKLKILRKDGTAFWSLINIKTYCDNNGNIQGLEGVFRDITEQNEIEEKLKDSNQKLLASNQQLSATEQQLRASNQQLDALNQQLLTDEIKLKKYSNSLAERVKELNTLYKISQAIRTNKTIEHILHDVVIIFPSGWQYPEIAYGRIRFEGKEYVSQSFTETKWRQSADIVIKGKTAGTIEIFYLEERPQMAEGPFLKEERKLINVIAKNISKTIEFKLSDIALKESEEKFRVLAQISPMAIMLHKNDKWIYSNPAAELISGYSSSELKNMYFWEFVAPEYQDLIKKRGKAREKGIQQETNYEFKIITKSGQEKWVFLNGNTVKMKGEFLGFITVLDITERKKAELALKESEAHYRQLFDLLPYGGEIINREGKIIECSPSTSRMLGYERDEIIGKSMTDFVDADTRGIFKQHFQKLLKGESLYIESCMIHKNGSRISVLRAAQPIKNASGDIEGMLAISVDITERKQAEEKLMAINQQLEAYNQQLSATETQLRATNKRLINSENQLLAYNQQLQASEQQLKVALEKAEESDKLKSAFLANMSHEIRTPMNGILGFVELLDTPDLSFEQQDKYIEIIKKSGYRMLNTVNDIIDISKIDAGQVEISNDVVNIYEEINNQVEFFNHEVDVKGIEMKLINNLPKQESLIICDEAKLNSILSNLIKNAIKYTDEGSIEIKCNKNDSRFEFIITDTGIGIPQNRINSIFNRFEQADIYDVHARQGSGLGLSISKAYVEMLGGDITVTSEEGSGSTFCVTLPWIEKQEKQKEVNKDNSSTTIINKKLNILIAEDDDDSFEYLKIILEEVAYNIARVKSGGDAVDYVKNHADIDLVFMDIKMPKMNGYEATKKIREFNNEIIIIAQTAYAFAEDKTNALNAGCNDYISKPLNTEKMLEIISKYF